METVSDLIYLRERCSQEFQLAQQASNPLVAKPHYNMAVTYQERAEDLKRKLFHSD